MTFDFIHQNWCEKGVCACVWVRTRICQKHSMIAVKAETAASHINTSCLAIAGELAQLEYEHRSINGAPQATLTLLERESQSSLDLCELV